MSWHGIGRVVEKDIGWLLSGLLGAQGAVAVERIGLAFTVEIVVDVFSSRQRPFIFIPPHVIAHDKNAHRRLVHNTVIDPLEPVVKPEVMQAVEIHDGGVRTEAEVVFSGDARSGRSAV